MHASGISIEITASVGSHLTLTYLYVALASPLEIYVHDLVVNLLQLSLLFLVELDLLDDRAVYH